jgi:GNAT superfamily N-acetyltransferase
MERFPHTADRVHAGYHALGNVARSMAGGMLVTNRAHTQVYDANVLMHPAVASPGDADDVMAVIERLLPPPARPHMHMGSSTPGPLEARLAADGWHLTMTLDLVLQERLRGEARRFDFRPVSSQADWSVVRRLSHAGHVEDALRDERVPYPEAVTGAITEVKRAKSPSARVWLAQDEGVDCGFCTSWDGIDGIGLLEDLFVLPEHRGRGVARALINRAVADARERGAGPVVIDALIDDTPKDLYRRMGFVPIMVRRCWMRHLRNFADPGSAKHAVDRLRRTRN